MTGYPPDVAALNHMQGLLSVLLNKPSGINIVTREIPASSSLSLSVDDIISIEKNNRTVFTTGSELGLYFLSETSDILGFLITGAIPTLDANCRADLRANGGQ